MVERDHRTMQKEVDATSSGVNHGLDRDHGHAHDGDDHDHDHDHGHNHNHNSNNDDSKSKSTQVLNPKNSSSSSSSKRSNSGPSSSPSAGCSHHGGGGSDADAASREVLKRLKRAMFLVGSFLVVEVVGGYLAGSLAVLSDAAHLFADMTSFAVAIAAAHLAALPTTDQHTFGLKRAESLAALLSMISLALVSLYLAVEAIRRLIVPAESVNGKLMSQVAFIGVCVNVALAFVLGVENHIHLPGADHGHSHDHHGHGDEHGHQHAHEHMDNGKHHGEDDHDDHSHDSHDHGHKHEHQLAKSHKGHGHESHDHGHKHEHQLAKSHKGHDHDSHDHGHKHEQNEAKSHKGHDHDSHGHGRAHERAHDHGHNHEAAKPKTGHNHDSGHNHGHNHDEESAPLMPSGSSKNDSYKAIHLDELAPDAAAPTTTTTEKKPLNNVNLQAAYLHVMGDLMQSTGVLIAGLAIWYNPKWTIIDPICTLLFCAVVFYSTVGVMRHAVAVLLQEVPPEMSWKQVYEAICNVQGVVNVHDLHVWSISHGEPALAVHCSSEEGVDPQIAMRQVCKVVNKMGITHVTIQMQQGDGECITCGNEGCDFERLSNLSYHAAKECDLNSNIV